MVALAPINAYICANVLLVMAVALLEAIRAVSARLRLPIAYRNQLRLARAVVTAAVVLPLVSPLSGSTRLLPQTAQVWSAPTIRDGGLTTPEQQRVAVSFGDPSTTMPLDVVSQLAFILVAVGLLFVLARLAMDVVATMRIVADASEIRHRGRCKILASERTDVPFSFWLPAQYFIVVPSALVLRFDDLIMSIRHEAQHHRQQDTKWVYLHQLLEAVFFWNPAVHRLERQLRELQEFACDEASSGKRDISAGRYCECLFRVAEAATLQRRPAIHAGMLTGDASNVLERRIEAVLRRPPGYVNRYIVHVTGAAALVTMAATALAFTSTIHDRRVSVEEAVSMAAIAQRGSSFPIAVNDRVVKQLNLLLSTPDGRAYLQDGLERMHRYEAFISEQLERHRMPLELLAVPLAEAGYRNLPQGDDPRHGAGLWMFVATMARHFGLNVDSNRDERLDVAAETGAAIRLLSSLYLQFNDWGLALLAYNAGSAHVQSAIHQTGSRDVWTLIDAGHENDLGYVARVMAAILIIENPDALD